MFPYMKICLKWRLHLAGLTFMIKVPFFTQKSQILMEGQKSVYFQITFFSELLYGVPRTWTCNNIDRKQSHLFFAKCFRAEKLDFYLKTSTIFCENGVEKKISGWKTKFSLWEIYRRSILIKILWCFVNSVKSYSDFSEWGIVNFQHFEERSNLLLSASTTTTYFLLHHFHIRIIK